MGVAAEPAGIFAGMADYSRSATIDIEASPAELFEIVTDIEAYPEWIDGMEEAEILETDDDGFPLRARMLVDAKIRKLEYFLSYEYEYPERMAWVSEGGDLKQIDGAYTFASDDDELTTVTYDLTIDLGFRVPGMLVRQAEKSIINSALEGLKQRAEE